MLVADVAIVGGGASGTPVAVHLLQQARGPFTVVLLERGLRLGRGIAYETREAVHLLNVPAGRMSAFPDDAQHFARWARASSDEFVPRGRYGDYLEHVLRAAAARAAPGVVFQVCRADAVSAM